LPCPLRFANEFGDHFTRESAGILRTVLPKLKTMHLARMPAKYKLGVISRVWPYGASAGERWSWELPKSNKPPQPAG
jgi:hypothetical protein